MKKLFFVITLCIVGVVMSCNESSKQANTVLPKQAYASIATEISSVINADASNPLLLKFLRSDEYQQFTNSKLGAGFGNRSFETKNAKLYKLDNVPITVLSVPISNFQKSRARSGGSGGPVTNVENPDDLDAQHGGAHQTDYYDNYEEMFYFHNDDTNEDVAMIRNVNGLRYYWPDGYEQYYCTVTLKTIDNAYNIGGKTYFKHGLDGFVTQNIPQTYLNKPKWKNFNECYQAKKKICTEDWQCDAACSINPCFIAYIAACVYEMW